MKNNILIYQGILKYIYVCIYAYTSSDGIIPSLSACATDHIIINWTANMQNLNPLIHFQLTGFMYVEKVSGVHITFSFVVYFFLLFLK